ncbi:Dimethylglycine dehydrogenase [Bacillus velezensis]|nr:Dimethylglycine dehydrogenase [Bacillus velezensis]
MKMHFDVVIIGAGIMGASLSYYLTKLGLKNIALCEQGIPPGNGATHKSGGFIRIFHENEWYTKRAVESYDTYADWGNKIGGSCGFKKTGFSFITDSTRSDQLRANAKKVNRYCSQVSVLSPDEFQQFQPDFSLEGIGAIVYEPNGGYADPAKTALTFIKQSEKKGMKLLEGVKVERILHHRKKITGIQTNIGSIRADKYVVANNIWANFCWKN